MSAHCKDLHFGEIEKVASKHACRSNVPELFQSDMYSKYVKCDTQAKHWCHIVNCSATENTKEEQ